MRHPLRNTLAAIIVAAFSLGQTTDTSPAPMLLVAPPAGNKTLEFKIDEGVGLGRLLTVPLRIAGKEYLFAVDTGATMSILDAELVKAHRNFFGEDAREMDVVAAHGKTVKAAAIYAKPLVAGDTTLLKKGDFLVVADLELVRQASGLPVQGMLGLDVLANYVVRFDFRGRKLELIDPPNFQPPAGEKIATLPLLKFQNGRAYAIKIPVAGVPDTTVVIDSGHDRLSISRETLKQIPGSDLGVGQEIAVADASGEQKSRGFVVRRKWSIGHTRFDNATIYTGGFNLLGLTALADFICTFDFPGQTAYLESIRDQHPAEPPMLEFGIGLKDRCAFVHDLNSDKIRGLDIQVGDRIVKVAGKDLTGTELWALRLQLRTTRPVTVTLMRRNETHDIILTRE